jgi:hypothetical protein
MINPGKMGLVNRVVGSIPRMRKSAMEGILGRSWIHTMVVLEKQG